MDTVHRMCLRSVDGIRDAKSKSAGRRTCDKYDHDGSRCCVLRPDLRRRSIVRRMAASLSVSGPGSSPVAPQQVGPTSEAGIGPAALPTWAPYRLASKESTIFRGCEIDAEVRATRTEIRRSDQAPRALSQAPPETQAVPAARSQPASGPAAHRSSWRIR